MRSIRVILLLLAVHITTSWAFSMALFNLFRGSGDDSQNPKGKLKKMKPFKHGYITSFGPLVQMYDIPKYGYFGGGYFAYKR